MKLSIDGSKLILLSWVILDKKFNIILLESTINYDNHFEIYKIRNIYKNLPGILIFDDIQNCVITIYKVKGWDGDY